MTVNMASYFKLSISLPTVVMFFVAIINFTHCADPYHLLCALEHFDYFNLTAVTWIVILNQTDCMPLSNETEPPSQCTVRMSFCHRLPAVGICHDSSICQTSNEGFLKLGGYVDDPFSSSSSSNNFQAYFPNGGNYTIPSQSACQLQTNVEFLCEHSAHWLINGSSHAEKQAPDPTKVTFDAKKCQVNYSFKYAGACKIPSSSGSDMSGGTAFLAVFFASLIFYFVFGWLINKARGRSGAQAIPHAKFWTILPVYIMDGCQFFFCCGRQPVTTTYDSI